MANDISIKFKNPIEVKNKDFEIVARKDGKKLGTLLVSKGNVEWVPVGNSKNKRRLGWAALAKLMEENGKIVTVKD